MTLHTSFISRYRESIVPDTTTISSMGIGIAVFLATRGFKNSLLNVKIQIVMIEIITAMTLMLLSC